MDKTNSCNEKSKFDFNSKAKLFMALKPNWNSTEKDEKSDEKGLREKNGFPWKRKKRK